MAKITMELIKELREKTQVGMMDCKKALIQADGNLEKAIEILRKKGAAVAAKRADSATNNGHVESCLSNNLKVGALVKIGCETDFSAKTDDMKKFSESICQTILQKNPDCVSDDVCCLLKQKLYDNKITINDSLNELIAKIGEKTKIEKFVRYEVENNGLVNAYIHPGANLGVIVELTTDKSIQEHFEQLKQLSHDICMQIAVTNPLSVDPDGLDPEILEKELEVIKAQLAASNKPESMIDKIAAGKMNKYYEEVCLLNQKFIKDDKITIKDQIKKTEVKTDLKINIKQYKRFAIGK
ncbi:elongation factor Ts [Candidatus Dependentiae bacterium]|nr:elongation factor Ts [Candidatus Dependentiae bacterium]